MNKRKKHSTSKGPTPNSNRTKGREMTALKRGKSEIQPTKYQRRAELELKARLEAYTAQPHHKESGHQFTKPGSLKRKKN